MRAALLVLVVVLTVLCMLWQDTARVLTAVNNDLQAQVFVLQHAPHPVHDANLTAFHEPDGSILIVVNGRFPHRIADACTMSGRF